MLFSASIALALSALAASAHASSPGERSLFAASKRAPLRSRSNACRLRHDAELTYMDVDRPVGSQDYIARVQLSSDRPVLALEDIEEWLGPVHCEPESIVLSKTDYTSSEVIVALDELVGGHLITAHEGCNPRHEHAAYQVMAVEDSSHAIKLSVTTVSWETAFNHIKIKLEYTDQHYELRAHRESRRLLRTRQEDASPTQYLSQDVPSFTPPAPGPEAPSSDSSTSIDLSFDVVSATLPVPKQYGFALKCNECKTTGTVSITVAEFDINVSQTFDISGSVTAVMTGFTAHADLSATLSNHNTFQVPLGNRTIDNSITIPGIGRARFSAGLFLAGGWDYTGSVEASSFGFDMTVPDGAQVVLDVSDFSNTGVSGFNGTTVTPLPFVAHAEVDGLGVWTALRSTIAGSFAFDVSDVSASGDAGVYVDTPILIANATKVTNVDENCQSTSSNPIASALRISFSEGLAVGAYAGFQDDEFGINYDPDSYYEVVNLPSPIQGAAGTQCRKFDNGEYEAASAAGRINAPIMIALAIAIFMLTI